MSLREVLGEELAGNCGFSRVYGGGVLPVAGVEGMVVWGRVIEGVAGRAPWDGHSQIRSRHFFRKPADPPESEASGPTPPTKDTSKEEESCLTTTTDQSTS